MAFDCLTLAKFDSDFEPFVNALTFGVSGGGSGFRNDKVGEDAREPGRCGSCGGLVSLYREEGVLWFPFWTDAEFWEVVEKSWCVVNGAPSASWDTQWLYNVVSVNDRDNFSARER